MYFPGEPYYNGNMVKGSKKGFEFIDHTGDIGIRMFGRDREAVFEQAAKALFHIITDLDTIHTEESRKILVESDSWEPLLIAWLNEFIYLFDTQGMLFRDFQISFLDGRRIEALAGGEAYARDRHPIKTTVKGATYHRLRIFQQGGIWVGEVILDI